MRADNGGIRLHTTDAKGRMQSRPWGKRFTAFSKVLHIRTAHKYRPKHFRDTVVAPLRSKSQHEHSEVTLGHTVSKRSKRHLKYVEACPKSNNLAADILWERFSSVIPETSQDAPQALKTKIGGNDTPSK